VILDRPLLTVSPTVDGDVLTVLARADAAFTAPRIQTLIGRYSVPGVRKALHRLVDQGVVSADRSGRTMRYWLNRDHVASNAIIELAHLSESVVDRIRVAVAGWSVQPVVVSMFGSAARGDMDPHSDIDLFVVGTASSVADDSWADQIAELERLVSTSTGNDARVLQYRTSELDRGDDPVLRSIVRDAVHIAGDRTILRSTIGQALR
jgi:predicted nucleotidyltransferase